MNKFFPDVRMVWRAGLYSRISRVMLGLLVLASLGLAPRPAVAQGPPTTPALPSSDAPSVSPAAGNQGCTNWYVSYGGKTSFTLLHNDSGNASLANLHFDTGVHDPYSLASGYLDFDGDGRSDIFSTALRPDGNYQWRYSSGGTSHWINLAYAADLPLSLRFGDFNGDHKTDVFSAALRPDGNYQWRYSPGGVGNYVNLAYANVPPQDLRFGYFDNDSKSDVFAYLPIQGIDSWVFSSGGMGSFQKITSFYTHPTALILFGDFYKGLGPSFTPGYDGLTDIFYIDPNGYEAKLPGNPYWVFRTWDRTLNGLEHLSFSLATDTTTDLSLIRLGNFDNDKTTDVFWTSLRPDGNYQWQYRSGGEAPTADLAYDPTPPADLRFGDFNGDGLTDVFKMVPGSSCNLYLPVLLK